MSTLERIEKLEKQNKEMSMSLEAMSQFCQQIAQKSQGIEQSATQLAKTLSAVTKVLVKGKVIDDMEVLEIMRKEDETQLKSQITGLVESGIFEKGDVIGPNSVVLVKQSLVDTKSGNFTVLSNYTPLEMSRQDIPETVKKDLIGKKVKDTYSFTDRPEMITILEIYNAVEIKERGDTGKESPSEDKTEEKVQEEPSES